MSGASRSVLVVKLGSSSVTTPTGHVDTAAIGAICAQVAAIRFGARRVVVVSSGAIAVGWSALGEGRPRSKDPAVLQAVSAVGQPLLVQAWIDELGRHGLVAGQVLLAPLDFIHRQQYLHARQTLDQLLEMGVVPIVNENDAVADDEIRFGDNDRLAALVANLVGADRMVLLTDTPGLLTADPRQVAETSLIEEVIEIDHQIEQRAGGPGSPVGSGGMASKLAAAKIATWSGVETVIAEAGRPGVLASVMGGEPGAGTVFRAKQRSLPARKLWIAFARGSVGSVVADEGARKALVEGGRSLLAAGVTSAIGAFEREDAVEVLDGSGSIVAKGLVQYPASRSAEWLGRRSEQLPDDLARELIHRDDMVVLGE